VDGAAEVEDSLAAIAVSVLAVTISLFSLLANRRKDRRDVFLRLHEMLISPELQNGRRVLFDLHSRSGRVEDLSPEDYASANRALAVFDVAGLYCHKKYVREKEFLELWDLPLVKMKYAAEPFVRHRDAFQPGTPVWPHYRRLADHAEESLRRRGVDIDQITARTPTPVPPGS